MTPSGATIKTKHLKLGGKSLISPGVQINHIHNTRVNVCEHKIKPGTTD